MNKIIAYVGNDVHQEFIEFIDVIAPKRSGDRIKTDKRDARNLGRLYRAGELVSVQVPSPEDEADRSVVRLREQIRKEVHQSKQYILKFLQVRGLRYQGAKNWTQKHWDYVRKIKFESIEEEFTYRRYIEMLEYKMQELSGVEEKIKELALSKKYKKTPAKTPS
ncbi:MAG: hypothetical protein ABH836_01810 [Candidatus Omnitrophota bacterium]